MAIHGMLQIKFSRLDLFSTIAPLMSWIPTVTAIVDPSREWDRKSCQSLDQEYLWILNVAVGGTKGWLEDGVAGRPWM